jgi:hypothetical protein
MNENNLDGSVMADASMLDPMDDLFGDSNDLAVTLPSASLPIPAALALRVAELQNSGCCT